MDCLQNPKRGRTYNCYEKTLDQELNITTAVLFKIVFHCFTTVGRSWDFKIADHRFVPESEGCIQVRYMHTLQCGQRLYTSIKSKSLEMVRGIFFSKTKTYNLSQPVNKK